MENRLNKSIKEAQEKPTKEIRVSEENLSARIIRIQNEVKLDPTNVEKLQQRLGDLERKVEKNNEIQKTFAQVAASPPPKEGKKAPKMMPTPKLIPKTSPQSEIESIFLKAGKYVGISPITSVDISANFVDTGNPTKDKESAIKN